ncbi:MAG: hypothetical protein KBC74_02175 [Candidatus Pacebacteria bacterium]|nr:hypothetical protein [Candidatus Paceibacterota bacterium]MBP9832308.1 hypothetical protein [Candidatus Paceibacterota bacterium]
MNETDKLRTLLKQIREDASLPGEKEIFVQLLNTLIRSNELVYRYDEYYKAGYHLGYFLIQSQRIEKTVAGVIDSAEKLRARTLKVDEREIDLNIPLGVLINRLKNYIEGDSVFVPLIEFNEYRKVAIHRLSEDFSRSLVEIEMSIAEDYPPEKVNGLQNILIEVTARIGQKILDLMENTMAAKSIGTQLGERLLKEVALPDLEVTILENPK